MKITLLVLGFVVSILSSIRAANAYIAEVNLFDLGCPTVFNDDSPSWSTNLDLGITFKEISRVYIDWSGEIKGGLVARYSNPDDTYPVSLGIRAYFESPIGAYSESWGGGDTYPVPEPFDCQSDFQLFWFGSWSGLLDGRATIFLYRDNLIVGEFDSYIEYGSINLDKSTLVVEGIVPEPSTIVLLGLGFTQVLRRKNCNNRK
jgi:hypothetical protein